MIFEKMGNKMSRNADFFRKIESNWLSLFVHFFGEPRQIFQNITVNDGAKSTFMTDENQDKLIR